MADEYGGWEGDAAPVQSPSPTYRSSADGRLVSLSMPSPGVSAAAFLALAEGQERFFWEDVRDDILFAGFGVAAHLLAWGPERFRHIEEQARALLATRCCWGRPTGWRRRASSAASPSATILCPTTPGPSSTRPTSCCPTSSWCSAATSPG
jgi:hypothetical protein